MNLITLEKGMKYLLHFVDVRLVLVLGVGQEVALAAHLFVVHLEDMGNEALRSGRLVVAKHAHIRLGVRIEMPLEAPIVGAGPGTIAAHESFVAFAL